MDIETAQVPFGKLLVGVVGLMLHTGGQRHHAQIVGVHDGVNITGQTKGKFGQRNTLGQAPAGSRTLDIHGRPAGGLTDGTDHAFIALAKALHQSHAAGRFSFTQRRRADRGHINIFSIGLIAQTLHNPLKIKLTNIMSVRQELLFFKTKHFSQFIHGFHPAFSFLRDFPIGMFCWIKHHNPLLSRQRLKIM